MARGHCSGCYSAAWKAGRAAELDTPHRATECITCGAPIAPDKKATSVYCSRRCKDVAHGLTRERRGEWTPEQYAARQEKRLAQRRADQAAKTCAMCPASLADRMRSTKYCSLRCARKAGDLRRYSNPTSRERVLASRAAYYAANREARLQQVKTYAAGHLAERRLIQNARRARMMANPDSVRVAPRDWRRLVDRYRGRCAYCGLAPADQMDHVVPIIRGGRDGIGNILPACRSCNSSKSGRFITEWRRDQRRRAEIVGARHGRPTRQAVIEEPAEQGDVQGPPAQGEPEARAS